MSRSMVRSYRSVRGEPFELVTRAKHSLPVRLAGLVIRWRLELTLAIAGWIGWNWLTHHVPSWAVITLICGAAGGLGWLEWCRHVVSRRVLAVLTRHRLRSVFTERRIMNYSGNLPLLLWCRPTPVGDRVVLLLRAGINLLDLEANLPYLASGCGARSATARAVTWMTALVIVDIARRDPLATTTPVHAQMANMRPPGPRPPLRLVPTLDDPAPAEQGA
ncbi:MAG: hypothetical protein ACRDTD_16075 [Pseudonocardiaceae bacterium]